MSQKFLHIMAPDDQLKALERRLVAAGFKVAPSKRMAGGLDVRIREQSVDQDEVEALAREVAPDVRWGPSGAPVVDLRGYREGR